MIYLDSVLFCGWNIALCERCMNQPPVVKLVLNLMLRITRL